MGVAIGRYGIVGLGPGGFLNVRFGVQLVQVCTPVQREPCIKPKVVHDLMRSEPLMISNRRK